MGLLPPGGAGIGSGGGGLHFRSPPDIYSESSRANTITLRDFYFGNAANAAALAEFQNDQSLAIILRVMGADDVFQTYLPGNEGAAYDATQWVDRTDAVRGPAGMNAVLPDPERVYLGTFRGTNTPAGGFFTYNTTGPTLFTIPAGLRLGFAYRSALPARPRMYMDGALYPDDVLVETSTSIALGHHLHTAVVTPPMLGGDHLLEFIFPTDQTV